MGNTYRAFISYSHSDAGFARWLHARLETYRLPGGIAQLAPAGESRGRLGPIFRDREELPASQNLSAAVRAALAASDVLVVLCSPEARASLWVAREIELFRELGPERPILAAIVRGEPGEAFPEALTAGFEPLAADLRKQGDGRRLGFLKIVAGIAGVPLDTLVQRDAQRNLRRVTAVTLVTAAATLVMAVMTVIAIQARNEAERQRAEAEGLVKYMLNDLRDELQQVGRLDLMAGVSERALAYYNSQCNLAHLAEDSLERCARGFHAVGEIDLMSGNLPAAHAKFQTAHRATLALLEQEPDNPDRIFLHGQSEYWLGLIFWRQRDFTRTGPFWRGYLKQAERLAEVEAGSVRSLMELGYANGNLCELLTRSQDTMKAGIALCRQAIRFEQQAVDLDPDDVDHVLDLANRNGWLADALARSGDFNQALRLRQTELELVNALAARKPDNAKVRLHQTWPFIGIGQTEVLRGRYAAALSPLVEARSRLEGLARDDPTNVDVSAFLIRTLMLTAISRQRAGHDDWESYRARAREVYIDATMRIGRELDPQMRELLEL